MIIDTDVIVRGERGSFDLSGWIADNAASNLSVSAITVAEIWHGVERSVGSRRVSRVRYLESALAILNVVDYTFDIARVHARLWARLVSTGAMIGLYDLVIAATALSRNEAVVTFNARNFGKVPQLKVIVPGWGEGSTETAGP